MTAPDSPERQEEQPPKRQGLGAGELFRVAWGFYLVLAILGMLWFSLAQGSLALEQFINSENLLQDLLLGVVGALALVGAWRLARLLSPVPRRLEQLMADLLGPLDRAEIFVLALISGFAEELFFRGAMQSSLGVFWATLLFTVLHTGPGRIYLVWTAFAGVAGLTFAGLTLWRGNILAAVVAHFLVNWINLHALPAAAASPGRGDA